MSLAVDYTWKRFQVVPFLVLVMLRVTGMVSGIIVNGAIERQFRKEFIVVRRLGGSNNDDTLRTVLGVNVMSWSSFDDPEDETAFHAATIRENRPLIEMGLLGAVCAAGIFSVQDAIVVPERCGFLITIRLAANVPTCLLAYAAVHSPLSISYSQPILAGLSAVLAVGYAILPAFVPPEVADPYGVTVLRWAMQTSTAFFLSTKSAALVAFVSVVSFAVASITLAPHVLPFLFSISILTVASILCVQTLESSRRLVFVLKRRLRSRQGTKRKFGSLAKASLQSSSGRIWLLPEGSAQASASEPLVEDPGEQPSNDLTWAALVEGIVGQVLGPLVNLPSFCFRDESEEQRYQSFQGERVRLRSLVAVVITVLATAAYGYQEYMMLSGWRRWAVVGLRGSAMLITVIITVTTSIKGLRSRLQLLYIFCYVLIVLGQAVTLVINPRTPDNLNLSSGRLTTVVGAHFALGLRFVHMLKAAPLVFVIVSASTILSCPTWQRTIPIIVCWALVIAVCLCGNFIMEQRMRIVYLAYQEGKRQLGQRPLINWCTRRFKDCEVEEDYCRTLARSSAVWARVLLFFVFTSNMMFSLQDAITLVTTSSTFLLMLSIRLIGAMIPFALAYAVTYISTLFSARMQSIMVLYTLLTCGCSLVAVLIESDLAHTRYPLFPYEASFSVTAMFMFSVGNLHLRHCVLVLVILAVVITAFVTTTSTIEPETAAYLAGNMILAIIPVATLDAEQRKAFSALRRETSEGSVAAKINSIRRSLSEGVTDLPGTSTSPGLINPSRNRPVPHFPARMASEIDSDMLGRSWDRLLGQPRAVAAPPPIARSVARSDGLDATIIPSVDFHSFLETPSELSDAV